MARVSENLTKCDNKYPCAASMGKNKENQSEKNIKYILKKPRLQS